MGDRPRFRKESKVMQVKIDPAIQVALNRALKKVVDTEARDQLGPGVHKDIEVTLTVKVGEMRIAQDTDKAPTASIPTKAAMALLLKRMGFQRDEAMDTLKEVMEEALTCDTKAEKALLAELGVTEIEQELKERVIAKLPRTPVKGKVDLTDVDVVIHSATIAEA